MLAPMAEPVFYLSDSTIGLIPNVNNLSRPRNALKSTDPISSHFLSNSVFTRCIQSGKFL